MPKRPATKLSTISAQAKLSAPSSGAKSFQKTSRGMKSNALSLATLSSRAKRGICFSFAVLSFFAISVFSKARVPARTHPKISGISQHTLVAPSITGIAYVAIAVSNLEGSRHFYANNLGLTTNVSGCRSDVPCVKVGSQIIEFDRPDQSVSSNRVTEIAFTTQSVAGLQAYLESQGIKTGKISPDQESERFEGTIRRIIASRSCSVAVPAPLPGPDLRSVGELFMLASSFMIGRRWTDSTKTFWDFMFTGTGA